MSSPYEFNFQLNAADPEPLNRIAEAAGRIGTRMNATAGDMRLFDSYLEAQLRDGRKLTEILQELAASANSVGGKVAGMAKELLASDAATRELTKSQAQLQREGMSAARTIDAAWTENARRIRAATVEIERFNAAQISSQLRFARGLAAAGSFTGVAPGGGSAITAITGLTGIGSGGAGGGTGTLGAAGTGGLIAGMSATTIAATAGIAALAGIAVTSIKAANSLGEYAREQQNLAIRTGLTTQETQLFSRAAGLVGVNAGTLTTAMRTLSKGLSENSEEGKKAKEALASLGIGAAEQLQPMAELLPLIFRQLGQLPDGAEKDRLAIALLGRSALELLPLIDQFDSLTGAVKRSGIVMTEEGVKAALEYQRHIKDLGLEWDAMIMKFKEHAVGVVDFVIKGTPKLNKFDQFMQEDINPFWQGKRALNLAGFGAFGDGGKILYDRPDDKLDLTQPKGAGASNASRDLADTRRQELAGINQRFETAKERLTEHIKGLKEAKVLADATFLTADSGARPGQPAAPGNAKDQARANVENLARSIQAAEKERDALKDGKRETSEILTLRGKLAEAQAKELFGEQKINAEHEKALLLLKYKHGIEQSLIDQIAVQQNTTYQNQVARTRIETGRTAEDRRFDEQRLEISAQTERRARLAKLRGADQGDDMAGVKAAYQDRIADTNREFDLAQRRIASDRNRNTQDEATRPGDQQLVIHNAAKIQEESDKAASDRQRKLNDAALRFQEDIAAVRRKDAADAERSLQDQIRLAHIKEDIQFAGERQRSQMAGRLSLAQAGPGMGLSIGLGNEQRQLQMDIAENMQRQARIAEEIRSTEAEILADKKREPELLSHINSLRIEGLKSAADLEKQISATQAERRLRLTEEYNQQKDKFASSIQGGFQALVSGGGRGLSQFMQGQATGIGSTIVGNAAKLFYDQGGIAGRFTLPGTSTTDAEGNKTPTRLGQVLSGTMFGPQVTSPEIKSQTLLVDSNTALKTAIDANTRAQLERARTQASSVTTAALQPESVSPALPQLSSTIIPAAPSLHTPITSTVGGPLGILNTLIPRIETAASGPRRVPGVAPLPAVVLDAITKGINTTSTPGTIANPRAQSQDRLTVSTDKLAAVNAAVFKAMTGQNAPGAVGNISLPSTPSAVPGAATGTISALSSVVPGLAKFGSDINGLTGQGGLSSLTRTLGSVSSLASGLGVGGAITGALASAGGAAAVISNIYSDKSTKQSDSVYDLPRSGAYGGEYSTTAKPSTPYTGGILGGAGHIGDFTGIFTGVSNTKNGAETLSGSERVGAAIGTAAMLYGAERGIAAGIRQGGAKGLTSAAASGLGAAAALTGGPTNPLGATLTAAAMVSGLISSILPDPRIVRQKQIARELAENVYLDPVSQNRTQDIFGKYTDYDKYGKVRGSDLSAIPQVTAPYITLRNGQYYDVPGQETSQFGGTTAAATAAPYPANPIDRELNGTGPNAQPGSRMAPITNINITAFDSKSVHDYFRGNPDAANSIVHIGLTQANGPAQQSVRETAGLGL